MSLSPLGSAAQECWDREMEFFRDTNTTLEMTRTIMDRLKLCACVALAEALSGVMRDGVGVPHCWICDGFIDSYNGACWRHSR